MKTMLRILVVIFLPLSNINITHAQTNFWEEVNTGLYGGSVISLAINDSGHIFAGTYDGGIFRSTDNGNNWLATNNGFIETDLWITSFAINDSGHVFAGTYAGSKSARQTMEIAG